MHRAIFAVTRAADAARPSTRRRARRDGVRGGGALTPSGSPASRCASSSPAAPATSARRCARAARRGRRRRRARRPARRRDTTLVGSVADRALVRARMRGVDAVLHAATLHKPHVGSHTRQDFVDTNITGTLNLLEEAVAAGVGRFVFTSTTSAFGRALTPPPGAPAAWITEDVGPVPKNIYGATKAAAEDLCELVHRDHGLPVRDPAHVALLPRGRRPRRRPRRLRRRQPEGQRAALPARRHRGRRRARTGWRSTRAGRSASAATSSAPPRRSPARDLAELRADAPAVVRAPRARRTTARLRRARLADVRRASSASTSTPRARRDLGWAPRYDFAYALERLAAGEDPRSPLALEVGAKGYHAESSGPYTTR